MLKLSRGKRHSLVLTIGRYRIRAVPGRFRWSFVRDDPMPGFGRIAGKLFLVTWQRRNYAE